MYCSCTVSALMKIKADTLDVSALFNSLYLIITWNSHKVENFPVIQIISHFFIFRIKLCRKPEQYKSDQEHYRQRAHTDIDTSRQLT